MIKNLFYGLLLAFLSLSDAWAGFNHAQWSSGWKVDWESGHLNPTAQWVPASPAAGNAGFSTATGALTASSTAKYPLPDGKTIDVVARVIPDKPSVATALGNFAKKTLWPLQVGLAVFDLAKDLGFSLSRDTAGQLVVTKPDPSSCSVAPCYQYTPAYFLVSQMVYGTPSTSIAVACQGLIGKSVSGWKINSSTPLNASSCSISGIGPTGQAWFDTSTSNVVQVPPSAPTYIASSIEELQDKIALQSGWPVSSPISRALADAVASGEPLTASVPTLTGPTSVAGPTSTTTQQQKDPAGNVTGTATKVSQTTYNISYNNNTITNTSSTVITTTNPDGSKTVENQDSPPTQDGATDTPLPDVPALYTKKYPDGLEGVWQQKKDQLKNSPLLQLTNSLMPSIGTGGTCPSFMIPLDVGIRDFGVHDVAPPCYVWDWAKVIVIVSALLLARALIFGG